MVLDSLIATSSKLQTWINERLRRKRPGGEPPPPDAIPAADAAAPPAKRLRAAEVVREGPRESRSSAFVPFEAPKASSYPSEGRASLAVGRASLGANSERASIGGGGGGGGAHSVVRRRRGASPQRFVGTRARMPPCG